MALTATASVGETTAPRAKSHGQGQIRDEPVHDQADRKRGEHDEPGRQHQNRSLCLHEIAERHQPAVGEQQRRHKAEEEKARIEGDPGKPG
jgi:hypothetical protein